MSLEGFSGPYEILIQRCFRKEETNSVCYKYTIDFICCQDHSDDQLDQVLQTYQAYQESQSESQTPTRQLNTHITYHVAQATQAKIGSLVDMGANGGLAGSDIPVLSTSPRKSTVGYSV